MKKIPLTKGYVALVDDRDFERLVQYNWHARVVREGLVYAARKEGGKKIQMHHDILPRHPGFSVDHENLNGLDNRRKNLRRATSVENARNRRCRSDSRSRAKGVWYNARLKHFRAAINVGGKRKHIGYFSTVKDAAKAYAGAAKQYHGEFARTK